MYRRTVRFPAGCVRQRTGSEGPRHDPYSFEELEIEFRGRTVVAHMGLGLYIKTSRGRMINFRDEDKRKFDRAFRRLTGASVDEWQRRIGKADRASWRALTPAQRREREEMEYFDAQMLRYAM